MADLEKASPVRSEANWVRTALRARAWGNPLVFAIAGGLVAVVTYAWRREQSLTAIAVGLLVSGAALAVGAVIGFLFGIPRAVQEPRSQSGVLSRFEAPYQVNTNLEQISDWLTKIIVGVTLVQIAKIPPAFSDLADYVATAFGEAATVPSSFAAVVMVYFAVGGFLAFYLWTRVILATEFNRVDRASRNSPEFYEGLIEALLYQPPPQGFRAALQLGEEFKTQFGEGNWRVWRAMACAYAQQYSYLEVTGASPADLDRASNDAFSAVKRVEMIEPGEMENMLALFQGATPQENDLAVFAGQQKWKDLFAPYAKGS